MLPKIELAYFAGIIDGEGSICLFPSSSHRGKFGTYKRYVGCITICHSDKLLMKWVAKRFGGKVYSSNAKNRPAHWKPTYVWRRTNIKAATIVTMISPYLVIKRKQAALLLRYQATCTRRFGADGTPKHVQKQRANMAERMSKLNGRGPQFTPHNQHPASKAVSSRVVKIGPYKSSALQEIKAGSFCRRVKGGSGRLTSSTAGRARLPRQSSPQREALRVGAKILVGFSGVA